MALQGTYLVFFLLAAALMLLSTSANEEEYTRFLLQHFDGKPSRRDDRYCYTKMRNVLNRDPKKPKVCKRKNTFIHGNSDDIKAICTEQGGEAYKDMHRSLRKFQLTICKKHGGKPINNCKYRAHKAFRKIVISCDEKGRPIHFAESQTYWNDKAPLPFTRASAPASLEVYYTI